MKRFSKWKKTLMACALILFLALASCSHVPETPMTENLALINRSIDAFQALPAGTVKIITTIGSNNKSESFLYFTRTESGMDYERLFMHSVPRPEGIFPIMKGEKREGGVFFKFDYDTQNWVEAEEPETENPLSAISGMKFEVSDVASVRKVKAQGDHQKYHLTLTPEFIRNIFKNTSDYDFKNMSMTVEIIYEIDGDGMIYAIFYENPIEFLGDDAQVEEKLMIMHEMQFERGQNGTI